MHMMCACVFVLTTLLCIHACARLFRCVCAGESMVEKRQQRLKMWLNRICRHPVLSRDHLALRHFLACPTSDKTVRVLWVCVGCVCVCGCVSDVCRVRCAVLCCPCALMLMYCAVYCLFDIRCCAAGVEEWQAQG